LRKFLEDKVNNSKISNIIGLDDQDKYTDEKINLDISIIQEKSSFKKK
jgi:hypothetical protein